MSVKRVIDDYFRKTGLEGLRRIRDCFNNRISFLSKKKIETAFYKYRGILPLMLGYMTSRLSHHLLKGCNFKALTLFSAYKIQNLFIASSQDTYTPKSKRIFTPENVAMIPNPSLFLDNEQAFTDLSLGILPDGKPFIYLKNNLFQRILDEQAPPLYLP
jgi:hypothetical protein